MDYNRRLVALSNQLKTFELDEQTISKVRVDLTDMLEACCWYSKTIESLPESPLSRDQLEDFLIAVDVQILTHLAYHIDSLRKSMPTLLDAIGVPDDDT